MTTVVVERPTTIVRSDRTVRAISVVRSVSSVSVGIQGMQGPPGADGMGVDPIGPFETAEAIPSSSLVHVSQSTGEVYKADRTLGREAHGFVIAGASSGASITVYRIGRLTGLTAKTEGRKQWLSTGGQCTETVPTSGLLQEIGLAESDSAVSIGLGSATLLA